MDESFQRLLFGELAEFVEPLVGIADDSTALFDFLYRIGWDLESFLGSEAVALADAFTAIADAVDTLTDLAANPPESIADFKTALNAARTLFALIDTLPSTFSAAVPSNVSALPGDIINALTLIYLKRKSDRLYRLLEFLTVIRERPPAQEAVGDDAIRTVTQIPRIDLGRLNLLLTRPGDAFAEEYWPGGVPDRVRAIEVAGRLFPRTQNLLVPHDVDEPGAGRIATFYGRGGGPDELSHEEEERLAAMMTLVWPRLDDATSTFHDIGVSVGILSAADSGPGVFVVPFGAVEFVHRAEDLAVLLTGSVDDVGFQITGRGFETFTEGGQAPEVELALVPVRDDSSRLLIGSATGTRFEIGDFDILADLRSARDGAEVRFMVSIVDAALVVATDGADSFLRYFTSSDGSRVTFEVTAGWSNLSGFHIQGSSALESRIPAHVEVGPIVITGVVLRVASVDDGIDTTIGADLRVRIGPITAVVQDVGLRLGFAFPPSGGNAGPLDLAPDFKPPTGAGLVVDAGVVTGGGFLFFDPDRGEYAGVLELEFADFLSLKGIGLISTRMPDSTTGFSLLIVLTGEFPDPGLQLGYGFKLLAVGGVLGLNRTVRIQALMEGVRTGAIESVMFPRDVIANAPRILSDLRTFFPPERDRFLIGPMAKLAWGTPTLITISLAVIVEIPGNITFVGVLRVALPTEDSPLLLLQVNFAGVIEPDQQRFYFAATLFESRVMRLTIDGDMGVLIAWGNDPNLVLTVGGFHPAYKPPPLPFPTPRRVSLDILNETNARIRVSGYFAVTSNTAQFGAHAELYFKFSAFRVEGHVGFDALFQLSPFAFAIQVTASVSFKAFGVGCFSIHLRFALEGPTPWRAHGRGSVSLFFFDISANFDITWGEHRDTLLPPIRVLPILAAEFAKPENWQTRAPATKPLVTLRALPEVEADLVLHPLGTLFITQRAIPLDLRLDRIGAQRPSDANRLTVEVVGHGLTKRADVTESFAPGQFQDMDDAAKLSQPAFQPLPAGLELASGGAALSSVSAVRRSARYEEIIIDTARRRESRRFVDFAAGLFSHFLRGNSTSRSPLAQAQQSLKQPFADTIRVTGDTYTVAHTRDNTATAPPFTSETAAREFLTTRLAHDPGLAGTLHVIPSAEVSG